MKTLKSKLDEAAEAPSAQAGRCPNAEGHALLDDVKLSAFVAQVFANDLLLVHLNQQKTDVEAFRAALSARRKLRASE
ncbi:hypothetical protein [Janthinobacterium sp. OK676]|uniref:hypothetical protein n=1 Tax=Janthinobacterium sp. OK676 TaxID=1855295 RepID=UPI00111358D3|nr:hypothetical protein [Janthinobacterium sp. OK676]